MNAPVGLIIAATQCPGMWGAAASPFPGPELVVNGDMDGATGWTITVLDGPGPTMAGAMVFDGTTDAFVDGTLTEIPADGTYRATWTEGSLCDQIGPINAPGGIFTPSAGAGSEDFAITGAGSAIISFPRVEYAAGTLDGLSIRRIS